MSLSQRQNEHIVGIIEAIIGHGIAAVCRFGLIAGKLLAVGNDIRHRQIEAVLLGDIAERGKRVRVFGSGENRLAKSGIHQRAFAHGKQNIIHL